MHNSNDRFYQEFYNALLILELNLINITTDEQKFNIVRIYQALNRILEGVEPKMRHWLNTYNKSLECTPLHMLHDKQTTQQIVAYLEIMANKYHHMI